jgi:hydrogenase/urease accessory protein HupE
MAGEWMLESAKQPLIVLAAMLLIGVPAAAHPEGFSGVRVLVNGEGVRAVITLHTRDFSQWFPPRGYSNYVAEVCRELEAQARAGELLEVQLGERALKAVRARATSPEVGMIQVEVEYPIDTAGGGMLALCSRHLIRLPRGHQQLLYVEDWRGASSGRSLLEETLSTDQDSCAVNLPAIAAGAAAATAPGSPRGGGISFFSMGVGHILSGYDHLLFLAALLLVCRGFGEAATVITCFTAAHSITLALAALNVVNLSPRLVEPAIAASIAYVGLENILGRRRLAWRCMVTFGFGLVHGLGFASALREAGLGLTPGGIALPVLKFNLGVEAGQLCVAGVVFPLLLWVRRWPQFERRWVPACSLVVALAGGCWLVVRILPG